MGSLEVEVSRKKLGGI